ncbi:hypothetical protein CUMW_018980 [Citrus unshiu]|nr:hypothetical protein CUMW_018980 [Citrus unshiu]
MDYVGGYAVALDMTAREIQSSAKIFEEYSDWNFCNREFMPMREDGIIPLGCMHSAGLPWTVAKGQDTFTPISSVLGLLFAPVLCLAIHSTKCGIGIGYGKELPKSAVPDPHNLELWLKVDGEIRQKGSTKDMIFKIPYLISHISSIMTLFEGDVILTGTPQGVGPVKVGQKITAGITGLLDVNFDIEKRRRPGSA